MPSFYHRLLNRRDTDAGYHVHEWLGSSTQGQGLPTRRKLVSATSPRFRSNEVSSCQPTQHCFGNGTSASIRRPNTLAFIHSCDPCRVSSTSASTASLLARLRSIARRRSLSIRASRSPLGESHHAAASTGVHQSVPQAPWESAILVPLGGFAVSGTRSPVV